MANNDKIAIYEIEDVETAFSGHAGYPFCEVWLNTADDETIGLRFRLETAELLLERLSQVALKLKERSQN